MGHGSLDKSWEKKKKERVRYDSSAAVTKDV